MMDRRSTTRRVLHATSFMLALKGAVGGSVATLALFGIVVPYLAPLFHISAQPNILNGGVAASVGAVLGVVAATRA